MAGVRAVTVGGIVKREALDKRTRLRQLIGLALASWVLVIVLTECGVSSLNPPAPHGPHAHMSSPLVSSLGHHAAEVVDHPHADDASKAHTRMEYAAAALPRFPALTLALVLGVVVAVALGWWRDAAGTCMRGPPRVRPVILSGRERLTLCCVARC